MNESPDSIWPETKKCFCGFLLCLLGPEESRISKGTSRRGSVQGPWGGGRTPSKPGRRHMAGKLGIYLCREGELGSPVGRSGTRRGRSGLRVRWPWAGRGRWAPLGGPPGPTSGHFPPTPTSQEGAPGSSPARLPPDPQGTFSGPSPGQDPQASLHSPLLMSPKRDSTRTGSLFHTGTVLYVSSEFYEKHSSRGDGCRAREARVQVFLVLQRHFPTEGDTPERTSRLGWPCPHPRCPPWLRCPALNPPHPAGSS